ncbi:MAG: LysR family transcriptional regulator [Clostridiales bacterium]|nr:LysR family transcriptional regulator [Clostridiales bacterium]
MTIQQLRYAVIVAELGSITKAAKALFITQPSLSTAIRELEKEVGIQIFSRKRSGVSVTVEGMEFLGYARQVTEPMQSLLDHYFEDASQKTRFCVSTQHYTFARNAFVNMVDRFGQENYEFILNETTTHQILKDVQNHFCNVGVLYLSEANSAVLSKAIADMDLTYTPLFTASPHIFVHLGHPLCSKEVIHLEDLQPYPRLNYIQGVYESPSFSEELFSTVPADKQILVSDSGAIENFMVSLNGYTISTGIHPQQFHRADIIALPLDEPEHMEIGYLLNRGQSLSELGEIFVESLKGFAA